MQEGRLERAARGGAEEGALRRRVARQRIEGVSDVTGGFDPPERYYLMVFDRYLDFAANRIVGGLVLRERQRASSGG